MLRFWAYNDEPSSFTYDFDIKIGKEEEAMTLLQDQTADGANFMAYSSRLALESEGLHKYYAYKLKWNEHYKTLTSIISYTGVPKVGHGTFIRLIANARLGSEESAIRFGFEFLGGTSGLEGISTASSTYFTLNGKIQKLDSMDIVGLDPKHKNVVPHLKLRMRDSSKSDNQCELDFTMKFKMVADVQAAVVALFEIIEHGYTSGWCYSAETKQRYELDNLDSILLFDSSVL